MRHVGHDLQRVAVAGHLRAVELRLDARLVDEVLRRTAAEHHRRRPRPADDQVRRFDDVADDVDVAGAGALLTRLREPHADGRIGDRRTEDRHVGAVRRRQNPVAARGLPEAAAEPIQDFARGVGTRLERGGELGDPVVVPDEFLLGRIRVVHAVDALLGERRIVGVRRPEEVMLAARLMEIVIQVGARRDEAVDAALRDQVRDDEPQPACAQRAGHAEKNRHVVAEHLQPDAVRRREVAALKRDPLHARQNLVGAEPCLDGERLHRRLQEA